DAPPQRVRPHGGASGIGSERQKAVLGQYVAVSKGTMSELELSLFRQRSHEALKQKARRGALFLGVAAGYLRIGRDRIEMDPDQRVQDTLSLALTNLTRLQSVQRVPVWLRAGGFLFPLACTRLGGGAASSGSFRLTSRSPTA